MFVFDDAGVHRFNFQSDAIASSYPINMAIIQTLYDIEYNAADDNLYVMDAMGYTNEGVVRRFDSAGNYVAGYGVGLNPTKILFF